MYRQLARSQSLKAGVVFAIGGVCFAVGNLLLARALTTDDFAFFALVLAATQLATTLGPMGADTIINRHPVNPDGLLVLRIALTSTGVGLLIGVGLLRFYDVPPGVSLTAGTLAAAAGISHVAAAFFRSRRMFAVSLSMSHGQNLVILVAAAVAMQVDGVSVAVPLGILVASYSATAIAGWSGAFRLERQRHAIARDSFPWREGRTIIATSIAMVVLVQLERLAIPQLLGNEALATFAVLAAIAGSAFRVLQFGVGYTLMPRLRHAESKRDALRIIRSEANTALLLCAAATVAIWFLARPLAAWMTAGKYELGAALIAAAITGGLAKVVASFGSAAVTALGAQRDLARLRNSAWLSAGLATAGAIAGAGYGLAGVLFGVVFGWVVHAVRAVLLAWPIVSRYQGPA